MNCKDCGSTEIVTIDVYEKDLKKFENGELVEIPLFDGNKHYKEKVITLLRCDDCKEIQGKVNKL